MKRTEEQRPHPDAVREWLRNADCAYGFDPAMVLEIATLLDERLERLEINAMLREKELKRDAEEQRSAHDVHRVRVRRRDRNSADEDFPVVEPEQPHATYRRVARAIQEVEYAKGSEAQCRAIMEILEREFLLELTPRQAAVGRMVRRLAEIHANHRCYDGEIREVLEEELKGWELRHG